MSRTTRKRPHSFEHDMVWLDDTYSKKELGQLKAQWMNRKYYGWSMSKDFRNYINRIRRKHDRNVLYKMINHEFYKEDFSKWNCKDNNAYGYF